VAWLSGLEKLAVSGWLAYRKLKLASGQFGNILGSAGKFWNFFLHYLKLNPLNPTETITYACLDRHALMLLNHW
jgi:hypothetical protein